VEELLTVSEVAAHLKMAERTVQAMMGDREMPGFRIRGQWRVKRPDFERWLESLASGQFSTDKVPDGELAATESDKPHVPATGGRALSPQGLTFLTPRLSTEAMHRRFVEALGSAVVWHSDLAAKPLEIDLSDPVPERLRVYLYNATRPSGGRPLGEHKIQLVLPGMGRGERGSFDHSEGRMAILAGYSAEDDVYVLWDAGLYENFAWSRNVQVKADTITQASAGIVAEQERILRPRDGVSLKETVLASNGEHLKDILRTRIDLAVERLQEG